jgi:hypothetical protein
MSRATNHTAGRMTALSATAKTVSSERGDMK